MKDYFEVDSQVPVAPFPTTFRELQSELGWSDEEVGVGNEEMRREAPAEGHEDEAAPKEHAGQCKEVDMDAIRYSLDNSLKALREGCERHGLPTSGSKSKLLMRLDNFRMDLEAKMQTEIARKLYREKERKPVSLWAFPRGHLWSSRTSTTSRTTLSPVGARPASAREQRKKSTGETFGRTWKAPKR